MEKEITIHGKYIDSNNNYYTATEGIRFIYELSCEMNKSLKWYDKIKITSLSTYSSTCGDIFLLALQRLATQLEKNSFILHSSPF